MGKAMVGVDGKVAIGITGYHPLQITASFSKQAIAGTAVYTDALEVLRSQSAF